MGYRKFSADYLFNGYDIFPSETAPSKAVLITNDAGMVMGVFRPEEAGDGIEQLEGMLTPGFINTHCHLELSHMKEKIPPGTGLVPFLTRVIRERDYPAALIADAMQQAAAEMYEGGIVAVGDICNTTDSVIIKQNTAIGWHNFIEVTGFSPQQAAERFAYANKIAGTFAAQLPTGSGPVSLSPHAPYSVSEALFGLINDAAPGKTISIHNQEAAAENELYLQKSGQMLELYANLNINASSFEASGKSSLQTYLPWLHKPSGLLLVHNTCTGEEDLLFAQAHDSNPSRLFYCVCINANRYISSMNPPIEMLRKHHCIITLGTDSYASNRQLSMLEEMKTIQQQFSVPLQEVLQWATLNGAKALNMDRRLGSFEPGKQPGIVLISDIAHGGIAANATARRIRH